MVFLKEKGDQGERGFAPCNFLLRQFWGFFCCLFFSDAAHSIGDLPDPGIEPGSPTLRVDSLPSEPPGNPHSPQNCGMKTEVGVRMGAGDLGLLEISREERRVRFAGICGQGCIWVWGCCGLALEHAWD